MKNISGLFGSTVVILMMMTAFLSTTGATIAGLLSNCPAAFDSHAYIQYTYDAATDTLIDSFGVVWSH